MKSKAIFGVGLLTGMFVLGGLSAARAGSKDDGTNWTIDVGASFILPRGVPTLTTPLTGANPRDVQNGISGLYRQGRSGTINENEARQLRDVCPECYGRPSGGGTAR
jgi:hypothetical protein